MDENQDYDIEPLAPYDAPLENKAFLSPPPQADREMSERFLKIFEDYKASNDAHIAELERRGAADVLLAEKVARIDKVLEGHGRLLEIRERKAARHPLSTIADPHSRPPVDVEHKAAFSSYIRKGDAHPLLRLESKALSVGSEADGGYLAPPQLETMILGAVAEESPIRAIARSITVAAAVYKRPVVTSGPGAGWVGETEARPQTGTPTLTEMSYPTMELYAMPAATMRLLDDAHHNIEDWIATEVSQAFATQESRAFVLGDGVNQPKGFLTSPTVANKTWSWGKLGTISTGASGNFAATAPADALLDLVYSLKAGYRRRATFVMNRMTLSAVRRLRDETGQYLWQPGLGAGQPATLLGYPIAECDDMPDIDAGSLSIAFGDFRRGYLIVDRAGVHVLRDPFSAKPYVLFYTTKRVGGGVLDFNAIKLLKFAA